MEYGSRKTRVVESFSLVESLLWNLFVESLLCYLSFVFSLLVESYGNGIGGGGGGGFGFGYGGEGGKGSNPSTR